MVMKKLNLSTKNLTKNMMYMFKNPKMKQVDR